MSWMILINASMSTFTSIKKIHFEIEYVLQCIFCYADTIKNNKGNWSI